MKKLCFLIAFTLLAVSAEAKTLYVDGVTGNDAVTYANNSQANPWRTIGRASWGSTDRSSPNSNEAAQAGDTVIVKAGTYTTTQGTGQRYNPIYNPVNSGTAGNYITFLAEGLVTLQSNTPGQGDNTIGEPIIGTLSRSYIIWDGFYIDEANVNTKRDTGPVVVWDSQNIILQNLQVKGLHHTNAYNWDDNHNCIRTEDTDYVTIRNNKLWNCYMNTTDRKGSGITTYISHNMLIENNEIYDSGSGIYLKANSNGGNIIRYNLIYDTSQDGITIGSVSQNQTKIYQNIIRNTVNGISFIVYNATSPANIDFVNNIIDSSSERGIYLKTRVAGGLIDIVFRNNILTNNKYNIQSDNSIGDTSDKNIMDFEHNNYYGPTTGHSFIGGSYNLSSWKSTFSQDSAAPVSITSDPQYINEPAGNFRLQPSSPARNAGIDVLDLDNDGNSTDFVNIGAYITGNEQIGIRPLQPLVVPMPPGKVRAE